LSPAKSRQDQEYSSSTVGRSSSPSKSPVRSLYRESQDQWHYHQPNQDKIKSICQVQLRGLHLLQNLQFGPLYREPRPTSLTPVKSRQDQEYSSCTVGRSSSPSKSPVRSPLNQELSRIHQGLCLQRIRQYSRRKMKVYAIRHPFDQVNVCCLFEHLKVTVK
jgi:hypothetical protein